METLVTPVNRPNRPSVLVPHPHRYATLDMLRGVAALAVICAHVGGFFGGNIFEHGYLAVDFFFMLSGFVLMAAYQSRLNSGWSTLSFMKLRIVRLYPLYLVGTLLGLCFMLLRCEFGHSPMSLTEIGIDFLTSLCFIPALAGSSPDAQALYPLDSPTWSLFYELLANLLQALFLRRRSKRFLLVVAILSAVILAVIVARTGDMNLGFTRSTLGVGFVRVTFAYSTGMLLFLVSRDQFLVSRDQAKKIRWSSTASALLLLLLLWAPTTQRFSALYDVLATTCAFPVLLFLSASSVPPQRWRLLSLALGNASYAVYVIHVPLADWYAQLWLRVFQHRIAASAPWGGILFLAIVFALAIALDYGYDLPARTFLKRKLSA